MVNLGVPKTRSKKRKKKRFTAAKAVKSMARAAVGTPPPVQREESRKRVRKDKYKVTLGKLLTEE